MKIQVASLNFYKITTVNSIYHRSLMLSLVGMKGWRDGNDTGSSWSFPSLSEEMKDKE